jgi:hypothetical protein
MGLQGKRCIFQLLFFSFFPAMVGRSPEKKLTVHAAQLQPQSAQLRYQKRSKNLENRATKLSIVG